MKKRITAVMLVMVLAMLVVPVTKTDAVAKVDVKKIEGDYDYEDEDEDAEVYEVVSVFSEGMAWVEKEGKYGYINQSGEEVIPCRYDHVGPFSEGMAAVKKKGKWGYINQRGKEVIPCRYDDVSSFSEGMAVVKKKGKWGYINQSGKEVISCQYDWATSYFSEGLALVKKKGKWGYINQRGKEVIPCRYDDAWSFSGGLALVEKDGEYDSYINQNGEKVISCRYDWPEPFSEGMAMVRNKGKFGYINQSGEEVIACQYDWAEPFSEGMAAVEKKGKWGYINQRGKEVIPCQYAHAADGFSEGMAAVCKDGGYGYINQSGEEVILCQYDWAWDFSEGMAVVRKKGKYGYINQNGEEVIPCQYDIVGDFSGGSALAKKGNQWYLLTLNANDSDNDNTDSLQAPSVKMDLVNITQTKLTWNKVSHASGYYIYRATSQDGNYEKLADLSSAKTSYIDTTCKQGDTYYYKVIAYNASGTQMTSDIQSKKIPVVETDYSIAAPTISSVEKSGKNIVIRWEKITKGNGYVIYRSTDNKNFNVYKVINGLGTTQLTDKNVKSGKKYFYRIATYYGDTAKQSPISPTYVINTKKLKDDSFKTTLISVTKKAKHKGTVTLKWKKLSNASGYIIYRKEGNGKYKSLFTINNASKESIDDVNLSSGKTYTYYIKPFKLVDSNGVKIKYLGSASNKKSIKE